MTTMAASFASGAGYAAVDRMADAVTGTKRSRLRGREVVDNDVAAGAAYVGDYVSGRRSVWRPARWSTTRRKLNKELYNKYVFYWGRLTKPVQPVTDATSAGAGTYGWSNVRAFQLNNWSANGTGGAAEYPVHMFELTTRPSMVNNHKFGHYLKESGSDAVGWDPLTGKTWSTGVETDTQYLSLWRKNLPGDMADVEYAVLDRVVVDLTLQGCRNVPCTFYVKLVQFAAEGLDPNSGSNTAANAFWRRVAHRLIGHPDAKEPPINKNPQTQNMRVLKSFRYYIAPSNTTDQMQGPALRRERLTFNLNRRVDFSGRTVDELNNNIGAGIVEEPNVVPFDDPVATNRFNYLPDIRARVYLMISATHTMQYVNATKITFDPDAGTAKVGATSVQPAVVMNVPQYDARFYLHYITPDK